MAQIRHILIVCGEASGDMNAAGLVREILKLDPSLRVSAVGGERLKEAGAQVFYNIKDLCVIGLFDVLKKLPLFLSLQKLILKKIKEERPDALILVDFSGFNLRLARKLDRLLPVLYYTSPQVWASRPGRVKTIKKYIDKMMVLFPFEEAFYKKYGVEASFVGHPLLDEVKPTVEKEAFLRTHALLGSKKTIALLPGSRMQEVKNILPVMLKAALIIQKGMGNVQFIIAKSAQIPWNVYNRLSHGLDLDLITIEDKTYDCLNAADFCLVASGTATLETALMEKPLVIIYKMNPLNYFLYRGQVKLPYIGMVNIVAQKQIVREFIQFNATAEKIAKETLNLLNSPSRLQQMKNDLIQVKTSLGERGASLRAAHLILSFL
ncbi:MAG: lipid-A-disaccharide synthase, partial [Candidatus Omnitrophota bacterium]